MWTRTDALVLKLCEYGYCFVTQNDEVYLHPALSSLGMGWVYVLVPLIIGVLLGGLFMFVILRKKQWQEKKIQA